MFNPDVGDNLILRTYVVQGPQTAINVTHWSCTARVGPTLGADDVAAMFMNSLATVYTPALANSALFWGCTLQRFLNGIATSDQVADNVAVEPPGTGGPTPLPGQVSGMLTKRTGFPGRSGRGRIYIPFPSDAFVEPTNNVPTAAYVGKLQQIANFYAADFSFVAGGTSYTFQPVLFRKKTKTVTPLTAVQTRPRWATQRRRGNYGRVNVPPS